MGKSKKQQEFAAQVLANHNLDDSVWSRKWRAVYMSEAKGLCEELAIVGVEVSSIGELRGRDDHELAIPVLLTWLPKITYRPLYSDIVSCLHNRVALPVLIAEFTRSNDDVDKWELGNAIAEVLTSRDFDIVQPLVATKPAGTHRYGDGREMLVIKLGRMKNCPEVVDVLISLLDEADLTLYAIKSLGRLRAKKAISKLKPFLQTQLLEKFWEDNTSIKGLKKQVLGNLRREAEKALKRIEAA